MQTKSGSSPASDPGSGTSSADPPEDLPGSPAPTGEGPPPESDPTPTPTPTPTAPKSKAKDAAESITPEAFKALTDQVGALGDQLKGIIEAVANGTSTVAPDVQAAVREALLSKEHTEAHERLEKGLSERGEQRPRSGLAELFLGKRA